MPIRLIIVILIICTSCQSGIIPCPKVKTAKLHKSFKPSASSLTARASQEPEAETRKVKANEGHFIQNVSVEEWDCPKPGKKRYMPKSVKDNIRKNKKKIESDYRENATDSLSSK